MFVLAASLGVMCVCVSNASFGPTPRMVGKMCVSVASFAVVCVFPTPLMVQRPVWSAKCVYRWPNLGLCVCVSNAFYGPTPRRVG